MSKPSYFQFERYLLGYYQSVYDFVIENSWLTMKDDAPLSVTFSNLWQKRLDKNFYVMFMRYVYENGQLLRQREWKETIPRMFN